MVSAMPTHASTLSLHEPTQQGGRAMQVLVSIQSLILVDEPYFCEPGYEASMHTAQGQQASQAYSLDIRSASCTPAPCKAQL